MTTSDIIAYRGCIGQLSLTEESETRTASVIFEVNVDKGGAIHIIFQDQPLTQENSWITRVWSSSSPSMAMLQLRGVTGAGLTVESDWIILRSVQAPSTPASVILSIKASAAHLTVRYAKPTDKPGRLKYWIADLLFYRGTQFEMPFGNVGVRGGTETDAEDPMTGIITVQQKDAAAGLETWIQDADKGVRRMLGVLSFASGSILRANVMEVYCGDTLVWVDFAGGRSPAPQHKPPLHFLDLANTFPPLAKAYDAALIERTGLDVAIEWHLMPHAYDEARFVAQMTAVEHLVSVFQRGTEATYLPSGLYAEQVKPFLAQTLADRITASTIDQDVKDRAIEGMTRKLGDFHGLPLQDKLVRMLAAYRVPLDGLTEWIGNLIRVRNNIVHRGLHDPRGKDIELAEHVAAAEELVRRIVFALLGFQGRYQTWFGRVGDRECGCDPEERQGRPQSS